MCLSKRWIYNSKGQKLFVPCGHCPACKQSKAIQRSMRIKDHLKKDGSTMRLFVTLNYRNRYIPYFRWDEFVKAPIRHINYVDKYGNKQYKALKEMTIYRDSVVRWVRSGSKYDMIRKQEYNRQVLGKILVSLTNVAQDDVSDWKNPHVLYIKEPLHLMHHKREIFSPKISVCWFPDVQDFLKRLRRRLTYHCKKNNISLDHVNFTSYQCTEYGPETNRSHIHLLLDIPSESYELFKSSIMSAWSFNSRREMERGIEISINAAQYVASYVNFDANVPALFTKTRELAPKKSMSRNYGFARKEFSLLEVLKAVDRGSLFYDRERITKRGISVVNMLLPKYVIHRAAPYFKGVGNLNDNEIQFLCERPYIEKVGFFARRLGLSLEEIFRVSALLWNKRQQYLDLGFTASDFGYYYVRLRNLYRSEVQNNLYKHIYKLSDNFEAYDNIEDFYSGEVISPSLDEAMFYLPDGYHYESDPNLFSQNVARSLYLAVKYDTLQKKKKAKNYIYSTLHDF